MIPSYDLLTIGHSNLAADRFMALLKSARVSAIADVRSVPFSRWCPWFSSKALAQRLAEARHRVCLLCAERDPLDCHRCLLIGRALAERGLAVGHILADGTIEPHSASDERLLVMAGGDLFRDRAERLAHAYRRRAQAVAARLKRAG